MGEQNKLKEQGSIKKRKKAKKLPASLSKKPIISNLKNIRPETTTLKCIICLKVWNTYSGFMEHTKNVHGPLKYYKCTSLACNYFAYGPEIVIQHYEIEHIDELEKKE